MADRHTRGHNKSRRPKQDGDDDDDAVGDVDYAMTILADAEVQKDAERKAREERQRTFRKAAEQDSSDHKKKKKKKKRKSKKPESEDEEDEEDDLDNEMDADGHRGPPVLSVQIGGRTINVWPLRQRLPPEGLLDDSMKSALKEHLKAGEKVLWKERRTDVYSKELALFALIPFFILFLPTLVLVSVYRDQVSTILFVVCMFLTFWAWGVLFQRVQVARSTFYALTTKRAVHGIGDWTGICGNHFAEITRSVNILKIRRLHMMVHYHDALNCDGGSHSWYYMASQDASSNAGFEGIRDPDAVHDLLEHLYDYYHPEELGSDSEEEYPE